jgi:lycopene cyclase domain-containing protein
MIQWAYLIALLVSIGGLAVIDRRYTLAYWFDRRRTVYTLAIGIAVFIIWDLLGIGLGIFFHGGSALTLPVRLLPEFPIEELFFLLLLCYVCLLLYRTGVRLWPRT